MKKYITLLILLVSFVLVTPAAPEVTVKIKDISSIDGLKVNQVFGYGLVVGLQGTGDTKSPLTRVSLKNLLKNLGMEGEDFVSKNTAAVLLTARLPAFVRVGDKIDITVSSIGDAKSLEGGILVQSGLKGANNVTYVVAQGSLSVAKPKGRGRGVKTVAAVSGGGVVEKNIDPEIIIKDSIFIVLREWDYSVADRIVKAVLEKYPASKPEMTNSGKIKVAVVKNIPLSEFVSSIEELEIEPSFKAKIVIRERDGTIVAGGNVKISEAMVSKEGVTVEIVDSDKRAAVSLLKESGTVKDLVDALNAIGASTTDIISILKALKESGALHAELVIK
ncbi:MAG: flagellar basal body P-ring protein FlgI [bacterium]|nr:flagellar basal body P-ring protein FlgI [bacterium]